PIWSKVSTPLRTKLRNELENHGVVFSNKFKEISDKLTNLIELGYQTSGETDYGTITSSYISDNSESIIGKGKQPVYNKSGLEPRTPSPKHIPIPTPIQAPAPKRVPVPIPKRMFAPATKHAFEQPPKCSPGPAPKDTPSIQSRNASPDFNIQQEHLGFHRYPFANIPFHTREERLMQEEDELASIFVTPITKAMKTHDSFVTKITKLMTTHDSFVANITKVMTSHDSFVTTITKVMTNRESFVTPTTKVMTTSSPTPTTSPNQGTGSGNNSTSAQALKDIIHKAHATTMSLGDYNLPLPLPRNQCRNPKPSKTRKKRWMRKNWNATWIG
ncbi:hypothetical protein E4U37_003444, partial [Claviceps purpurea]